MNENVQNRIKYLVEFLNKANIEYYINDNPTSIDSFNELLNQALNLKKIIFSKRIKNNKSKKNIVKKEFILTFDFPSPLTNENKEPKTIALLDDDSDAKIQSKIIKLQAAEKNFETSLRQRAEARRNKLKSYNYQFTHGRKTK